MRVATLGSMSRHDDYSDLPELAAYNEAMTPDDVAAVLNVTRTSVIRNMRIHALPGFLVGGSWRVRKADIAAVMRSTWTPPPNTTKD